MIFDRFPSNLEAPANDPFMPTGATSPMKALPLLAFGESRCIKAADEKSAARQAAATVTAIKSFHSTVDSQRFQSRTVNLKINGLGLCANAATPLRAEMEASSDIYFAVSLQGRCQTHIDGRSLAWIPDQTAIFIAESNRRYGESEHRSVVFARLERARLTRTIDSMLGSQAAESRARNLTDTRCIELKYGSVDFAASFRRMLSMIDAQGCNEKALGLLGFDDIFYRQAALCLSPDLLIKEALEQPLVPAAKAVVDQLCDAIRGRLEQPHTMSEMESMSGLSRRSLQAAFNERFGCPPMEWQKRERLIVARQRLSNRSETATVADVAFELGFSSASRFAAFYRSLYGESPAETIERVRPHAIRARAQSKT